MLYSEKLKFLRERQGIMQKEISKAIELSNTQYCNYENEIELLPIKHLNTLCNYFNISIDYIFSFTNVKLYKNINKELDIKLAGKRLKEFRKEHKITQDKLASILNTNQSVIANYERGRNIIATPFLYTICKKYGVSADYLLGKTDTPKSF